MRPTSGRKNQGKLPGEAINARQKKTHNLLHSSFWARDASILRGVLSA